MRKLTTTETVEATQITIRGAQYDIFIKARDQFRFERVNGTINEDAIKDLAEAFKLPFDEALAILAGQIPTTDDAGKREFYYDRADYVRLSGTDQVVADR